MDYRKKYVEYFGEIPEGFVVHHIDHDNKNNKLKNLVAIPKDLHIKYHKKDMYMKGLISGFISNDISEKHRFLDWSSAELVAFTKEFKEIIDNIWSYSTKKFDEILSQGLEVQYLRGEI
jgi:hypothetical protein